MRRFAILTMLFAWLLYGAMPALGACPMCNWTVAVQTQSEMSMPLDMAGMSGHDAMAASHVRAESTPCDGAMGHASFCPACLVIPQVVAVHGDKPLAVSYPAPGLVNPLSDNSPAPASPPPRYV
jgi:hypothetical protein